MSNEQVAVLAVLTARPSAGDEVAAALTELVAVVSEEPGVLTYALHRGIEDRDRFWFYELYRDQAAFDRHGQDPRFGAIGARLGELLAGPPELTVSSVVTQHVST